MFWPLSSFREKHNFLDTRRWLKHSFAAVGCSTLAPPVMGHIQRTAEGAVVRCNNTKESWSMMCKGTSWVGEMRNCSEGMPQFSRSGFLHLSCIFRTTQISTVLDTSWHSSMQAFTFFSFCFRQTTRNRGILSRRNWSALSGWVSLSRYKLTHLQFLMSQCVLFLKHNLTGPTLFSWFCYSYWYHCRSVRAHHFRRSLGSCHLHCRLHRMRALLQKVKSNLTLFVFLFPFGHVCQCAQNVSFAIAKKNAPSVGSAWLIDGIFITVHLIY